MKCLLKKPIEKDKKRTNKLEKGICAEEMKRKIAKLTNARNIVHTKNT